jgi:hypothetical protein
MADRTTVDPLRLKFVMTVTDGKSGGRWYYFRSKETGRAKLDGEPGTALFMQSYTNAQALRERIRAGKPSPATKTAWRALVDRYLQSAEFKALADSAPSWTMPAPRAAEG